MGIALTELAKDTKAKKEFSVKQGGKQTDYVHPGTRPSGTAGNGSVTAERMLRTLLQQRGLKKMADRWKWGSRKDQGTACANEDLKVAKTAWIDSLFQPVPSLYLLPLSLPPLPSAPSPLPC